MGKSVLKPPSSSSVPASRSTLPGSTVRLFGMSCVGSFALFVRTNLAGQTKTRSSGIRAASLGGITLTAPLVNQAFHSASSAPPGPVKASRSVASTCHGSNSRPFLRPARTRSHRIKTRLSGSSVAETSPVAGRTRPPSDESGGVMTIKRLGIRK